MKVSIHPLDPARALALTAAVLLAGCASRAQLIGVVTPMADGQLQSVVKAADKTTALRHFDNDAKLHCGKRGFIAAMDTKGKYVVVSQDVKEKSGKIGSSGDARIDAGIAVGIRRLGLERDDQVEVTTMFKCEG
jgi:major membrane immunogen (membrane-anchored lipoprotein)